MTEQEYLAYRNRLVEEMKNQLSGKSDDKIGDIVQCFAIAMEILRDQYLHDQYKRG